MFVLVTYDVATASKHGPRRLARVAKICSDFGHRVQNSVFECQLPPDRWAELRHRLLNTYEPEEDSLRFYFLGNNWQRRVEHHGTKPSLDMEGPLIA